MTYNNHHYFLGNYPTSSQLYPTSQRRDLEYCSMDPTHELEFSWMDGSGVIDPQLHVMNPHLQLLHLQASNPVQGRHQQPLDRYITEPTRHLFTTPPDRPQSFPHQMSEAIGSMPRPVPNHRYDSPECMESQPSSAQSPGGDREWYSSSEQSYSPQPQPMTQFLEPSFPEKNFMPLAFPPFSAQAQSCVSMDQIQAFQDLQDTAYDDNDGFISLSQANNDNYSMDMDNRQSRYVSHQSYRYQSDEGLGDSIKSSGSPSNNQSPSMHELDEHDTIYPEIDVEVGADADPDLDADADADIDEQVEETSDAEYTPRVTYIPRSTRTRKRPSSSIQLPPSPINKRSRISKAQFKKGGPATCKDCNHAPFKDLAALQRHINASHLRAYVCVFSFAGCNSTFASKNEWKRHVASQHLNFNAWVCALGDCGKVHASKKTGERRTGTEFNRKDLFTQHLRRMHAPIDVKRKKSKNQEWEDTVKELQASCLVVKRQAPTRLGCPMHSCDSMFEGPTCWDERMEHVAKHLETVARLKGQEVRQEDDHMLLDWAQRESIIEPRYGGGFKLVGVMLSHHGDEDAEGEDIDE